MNNDAAVYAICTTSFMKTADIVYKWQILIPQESDQTHSK